MILDKIADSLIRNSSGGKFASGTQFDKKYIKNLIHSFRAIQIEKNFMKDGELNPAVYQTYYLNYDKLYQGSVVGDYVLFQLPQVIQLGDDDGIRYAGSIGCSENWLRIKNRSMLSTFNNNKITKIKGLQQICYLFDGGQSRLEVYNDLELTEGRVEGVFANPTDVPSFNEDKDDYPLDTGAIAEIESMIYRDRTIVDKFTKVDNEFNQGNFSPTVPPKTLPNTSNQ